MAPGEAARARSTATTFPAPTVPRAYPYGIYDLGRNTGFVNVGTDHDTGAFAVASIRGWWRHEGRRLYPRGQQLLITADGGGSNGYRLRLWKLELQKLADETGLAILGVSLPAGHQQVEQGGTSAVLVHLLELARRTVARLRDDRAADRRDDHGQGPEVTCRLDRRRYPTGRKVTDEGVRQVNLRRDEFHGEWNYTIRPMTGSTRCKADSLTPPYFEPERTGRVPDREAGSVWRRRRRRRPPAACRQPYSSPLRRSEPALDGRVQRSAPAVPASGGHPALRPAWWRSPCSRQEPWSGGVRTGSPSARAYPAKGVAGSQPAGRG